MANNWVGIDVGGANIKIASNDAATKVPFELWKYPDQLGARIHQELQSLQSLPSLQSLDRLAVTMTGELADCFENKQHGVSFICDAIQQHCKNLNPIYYQTNGKFVDAETAKQNHLMTAAANWHALASSIGSFQPDCIVLDIGSTTTDIIPVSAGKPIATGTTDLTRLANSELVYLGASRTPLCAIAGNMETGGAVIGVASELFATVKDIYILLGKAPESTSDCQTADGRSATIPNSRRRIARMFCSDVSELDDQTLNQFAADIYAKQCGVIAERIYTIAGRTGLRTVIVVGEGDWLGREIASSVDAIHQTISLSELIGGRPEATGLTVAGPAWAVKHLAEQNLPE